LYTPACTFQSCTLLEAFPTPFSFLYSSAHIPSSTLLEKTRKTIKTTASQGAKEKSPLEKEGEEWYFPGLYGT
jgi:hypothetical protein